MTWWWDIDDKKLLEKYKAILLLSLLKMLILVILFIALANLKAIFLKFFLFSIFKMVDSMDIYKSFNINIGTVMKNLEMLKLVSNLLKTKKLCNHAFQILPYLFRYIPDQYKTQRICHK